MVRIYESFFFTEMISQFNSSKDSKEISCVLRTGSMKDNYTRGLRAYATDTFIITPAAMYSDNHAIHFTSDKPRTFQ